MSVRERVGVSKYISDVFDDVGSTLKVTRDVVEASIESGDDLQRSLRKTAKTIAGGVPRQTVDSIESIRAQADALRSSLDNLISQLDSTEDANGKKPAPTAATREAKA